MATIIGECETRDQLTVTCHARHQLPGVVVVDGEGLVSAGGGAVDARPVQHHLDQGPVLTGGPLERLGLFSTIDTVHSDVAILTSCEDVFTSPAQ